VSLRDLSRERADAVEKAGRIGQGPPFRGKFSQRAPRGKDHRGTAAVPNRRSPRVPARPWLPVALLPIFVVLLLTGCGGSDAAATGAGEQCRQLQARYPDQLETLRVLPPNIVGALRKNPANTAALDEATGVVASSRLVHDPAAALQRTLQLQRTPPADVRGLIDCQRGSG
jgi:hypothetical protein